MDDLLFNKKDVFSWSNCEEAKKYIGKEGYFVNSFYLLERDIVQQYTSRLVGVDTTEVCCFKTKDCGDYFLFLPIDKVKKPEKKWRAFRTVQEINTYLQLYIGAVLIIRKKKEPSKEIATMFLGTIKEEGKPDKIQIGSDILTLDDYFEQIEILWNTKWQPFGVTEE
jgi:hypothetical protein